MDRKLFQIVLIVSSMLFLLNCAGSSNDTEDFLTEDEKQEKELDDIEALLGISPSERDDSADQQQEQVSTPPPSEKLEMLSTSDVIDNSQDVASQAEQSKLEERISRLEQQVREKDRTIADLNASLTMQSAQMNRAPSGGTTMISDISMQEYEMRYNEARDQFEARNYEAAIQLFESLLAASTSHSLSDNAQFWIGESHYALRQYDAAIIDFEKVFTFSKSNKLDASQYKLGLCYLRKGDLTKAGEEFTRLINNYPNSSFSAKAENQLGKL